ncbi:MAG: PSD1 and planctomycete cytochrome C domain-containing protein [Rubripirellula sp.]
MTLLGVCFASSTASAVEADFFERKIRPIFAEHCYECHANDSNPLHASLQLDSVAGIRAGGDSGALLVPGDVELSLLVNSIRDDGDLQMPPGGRLSSQQIQQIELWIARGAEMPSAEMPVNATTGKIDYEAGRQFWSFAPLASPQVPQVKKVDWPHQRLDQFVLAKMEGLQLAPSLPADRRMLLRRTYLTLIGLPPTEDQVEAFMGDTHPQSFRRLVDRLLASPDYGQHWARWWLDLARYTDRTASWLSQEGQASFYRDWVSQALADDVPYDEFVRRQLATDMMDQTGAEDLSALGFLSLSPTYWKELKLPCEIIKVIVADEWEERVDVVSRTFLGLTAACARCHDHKFDPISMEDYYALAGVFASTRSVPKPLIDDDLYAPVLEAKRQVTALRAEIAKLKKQPTKPESGGAEFDVEHRAGEQREQILNQIKEIEETVAYYHEPLVNALSEESLYVVRAGKTAQDGSRLEYRPGARDLPLFIRGNPNRPVEIIPRRFLRVFGAMQPFESGSGRLELADAIFTDAKDLSARVIVNRVWMAFFGRGIVSTPSNFGEQGSRPTHPQLLDDLAERFVRHRWSLKRLHREIVLSSSWQQTSVGGDQSLDVDPENLWLSRMPVRKLTFEQWRDSMLVGTDSLDYSVGGESIDLEDQENHRRTLYSTIHRRDMSTTLMIHDFPDPTQHSSHRVDTTTPLQGLYALNGPLLYQQSEKLLLRLKVTKHRAIEASIDKAHQWLFARPVTPIELEASIRFLKADGGEPSEERWRQYLHVLLASNELQFLD